MTAATVEPASASSRLANEQVLYDFAGPNGAGPLSGVSLGAGGTLYGTTVFGGRHGDGDVYKLTPDGSGYTESILHTFGAPGDGSKPDGIVVANRRGDLFGETTVGGADQQGTVFELVPTGTHDAETVIHTFTGGTDGSQPVGTLVLNASGDLFGVTQFGGTTDGGVAFELSPTKTGYREQVLHDFPFGAALPQAGLTMAADGTLYGTGYGAGNVHTDGLVFRLRAKGKHYAYTDLYNFKGGSDGSNPFAALTIDAATGDIFGTTEYGGGAGGEGTVFELTPTGPGYTERVLHGFTPKQGALPESPVLLEANGDIFGTATGGGTGCNGGCGTVFELTPAGSSYSFKVLYRFSGPPDGAEPEWAPLVPETDGDLLGTTRSGGTASGCSDGGPGGVTGCGTLYQIES
ncbi:MAG: choice-of-anchor tandem repeat GloVer-containing protein [Acidimicrobiales bacterium]